MNSTPTSQSDQETINPDLTPLEQPEPWAFVVHDNNVTIGGHTFLCIDGQHLKDYKNKGVSTSKIVDGRLVLQVLKGPDEKRARTLLSVVGELTPEKKVIKLDRPKKMVEVHDPVSYAAYLQGNPQEFTNVVRMITGFIIHPNLE
ncbi:hypothetical protein [Anabaenopsis elenkinii]|uniref:Uncharacterized protein n=1 Tax=Anabaenopsis elenkinii CCIBt3563 TaxID=2779889 RepID=A0A7S6RGU9_9CYAN|nr:hypothetical protein [Anabaenopsis elenkinii]QOV22023.1 hypothetical protein IM676_15150 [Anabaenopsis elenkinii CCIBt3563]QOV23277.1 hypothetical protein IM676_02775 [Anabaenopsis elenkinii CCIBt3563]